MSSKILYMPALFFLGSFLLYVTALCGSHDFVDGAEIMGVGLSLGVAHPPGYPLIAMFLRLLSCIPLGSPCFAMNLLGVLGGALAVTGLAVLAQRMTGRAWAAMLVLPLLCHPAFFFQCLNVKGGFYSLLLACLIAGLLLTVGKRGFSGKKAALLSGLAVALQAQGGVMLAAALLAAAFIPAGGTRRGFSLRGILLALFAGLLGISLYLFLPIRSAAHPAFCWGEWHTLPGALKVLQWSLRAAGSHHGGFGLLEVYPFKAHVLALVLLSLGGNILGILSGTGAPIYAASLAIAAITALHFLPIDVFAEFIQHSLPLWICGITGVIGLCSWLDGRLKERRRGLPLAAALLLSAACAAVLLTARPDMSRYYAADDFARNITSCMPAGRGLNASLGDYSYDVVRFRQVAFLERPDVASVHMSMFGVPAYGDQLAAVRREFPWLAVPPGGISGIYIDNNTIRLVEAQGRRVWTCVDPHYYTFAGLLKIMDRLSPAADGLVVRFHAKRDARASLKRLLRLRYRSVWTLDAMPDRWSRFLKRVYSSALTFSLVDTYTRGERTLEGERAQRLISRMGP